jgi:apolipoprotein N-acyltransferase
MGLVHHMVCHRRRVKFTQAGRQFVVTAAICIPLYIAGIVWLGIETHSAPVVFGAILATIFVLIKAIASIRPS